MKHELIILILEALAVYFLVLWTHSLRHRAGLAYFYALLGGLTAVMSWVTDAGVRVDFAGISFMVGSTVFYTSLLLGVFVVYVFDGPRATRVAISTIAGVSVMVPLIACLLHWQMDLAGQAPLGYVPVPSLRINTASVLATVADLFFLAIAWEYLGQPPWRLRLWFRAFLTLLGVMLLDVLLFNTGAFAGRLAYGEILTGALVSRFLIALFASPFLYLYLQWQNQKSGGGIENRPVLTILTEMAAVRQELGLAQQEIERRKVVEREKEALIQKLEATLGRVRKLEGLLPVCAHCKRIRLESGAVGAPDHWITLEDYVQKETAVTFSHGLCGDCMHQLYPDLSAAEIAEICTADRRPPAP
ncbi:MAG: hypothetical protein WC708_12645 [Lentisphaeria bacterium]